MLSSAMAWALAMTRIAAVRGVNLNMIESPYRVSALAILFDRNAHAVPGLVHGALQPRAGLVDAGAVVIAVLRDPGAVVAACLGNRGIVTGALLIDHCHQVASLLQDVSLLIASRLDDGAEQRLTVLLQHRDVGLA